MESAVPYIAIVISGLTLVVLVAEKLFGGGNALANKFHALEKHTTTELANLERNTNKAIEAVRAALNVKIDEYEKVSTMGFETIRTNIHLMQTALLEFRAKMAEELHSYIRKDDYNVGITDIKRDVQTGFGDINTRLGQLQDLILHFAPDSEKNGNAPRHK